MAINAFTALLFLPFVVPIGIWVAWNDMKYMKIPNKAVLALLAVFVVIGLAALPFEAYLWRYIHFIVVLVIGFIANLARAIGAGDAKFLAAMAPFFDRGDGLIIAMIFASVLLAAFVTHRAFRMIPAMRRAFPDWQSWERGDFPMGLALSGSILVYLGLGATFGN